VNILDENILEDQRQLLRNWRVPLQQIGYEAGWKGMQDEEIISFLLGLRRPTLFTLDRDFYQRGLCHARYSLVYLDVKQSETAIFVRRVLRHRDLDTQAKRMGTVVRASHTRVAVWRLHADQEVHLGWAD
jgi:hypothetical protein